LDKVLAIWEKKLLQLPGIAVHLYMDDRSVGADDTEMLELALRQGREIEDAIGLEENIGKRQIWKRGEAAVIEHLGVKLIQGGGDEQNQLELRNGWEAVEERATRVHLNPAARRYDRH
jgi:hypothetical protein